MLTETQRSAVRTYLGHSDIFRYQDSQLEGVWGALSSEAETKIIAILGDIASVDTALQTTALANAGIKRVDEIWFTENGGQRREMRALGRMHIGRLSTILGVPIVGSYF